MKLLSFIKRSTSAKDLTVGHPLKQTLVFMIPMLIGNIFQLFYGMVDTIVVGQTLGSAALAGVGSTGSISFLILGFVSGLTHGFSVVTSQRRGAHDEEGMRTSFATGIVLTVVIISLLTVMAVFVASPLLVAMSTPEEIFPYACEYITTIFGGMLLSAFYNEFAATLRAIGDSVMPLVFLVFSSFLNIGLDCLFIMVFDMGVRGAAAATLVSSGISAVLTFVYMWSKYPQLRFGLRHIKPNLKRYATHLKLGVPMALQMSVVSVGMIFGQSALNSMNNTQMNAAYVAASRIDSIACAAINTTGAAAGTFVGQNYGAKRFDRIKLGIKQLIVFAFLLAIGMGGIVIALHRPLIRLFIPAEELNEELFRHALTYLVFNAGFYILLASLVTCRSALQGMGRGTMTLLSAAAEVVMRVTVSLIAIRVHDYNVVCMCNCASWLGANCILVPGFLIVLGKYVSLIKSSMKKTHLQNPSAIPFVDFVPATPAVTVQSAQSKEKPQNLTSAHARK